MKVWLALVLALALNSCTALPETPLDHVDLGTYVVTGYQFPQFQHGAMPFAQRMMGKTFIFGPDRIAYPPEFGSPDCQHQGYRLSTRTTAFLPPFDLGQAGAYSIAEAAITDTELLEVWNFCLSGVYLSVDRGKMYIPGRGALFILDRQ